MIGTLLTAWDVGNNNVLGRIRNVITFPIQVATFLGVYGLFFDLPTIIIAGLCLTVFIVFLGWGYMKTGLLKKEVGVKHKHTPQFTEILQRLEKIEGVLSERSN